MLQNFHVSNQTFGYILRCFRMGYYGQISLLNVVGFQMDFVVVALLFYVHRKHLRSCRDGQLT